MAKMISGTYNVADCEHRGDIAQIECLLRSNGCEVINSYWDGKDCGCAYVEFRCNECDFPILYKKFGSSATFDADINDYVNGCGIKGYKRYTSNELMKLKKQMDNDLSSGFENRLAFLLWFEVKERPFLTTDDIISECLKYLTDYEVIGYDTHIVDGCEYIDLLIKTTYKNLTDVAIGKNGIGDYCLSDYGWLKRHHIYGECSCNHIFLNRMSMGYEYAYLQKVMQMIICRENLQYRGGSCYHSKDIEVSANEYFNSNGDFLKQIIKGGITYSLKDPRFWVKCKC